METIREFKTCGSQTVRDVGLSAAVLPAVQTTTVHLEILQTPAGGDLRSSCITRLKRPKSALEITGKSICQYQSTSVGTMQTGTDKSKFNTLLTAQKM